MAVRLAIHLVKDFWVAFRFRILSTFALVSNRVFLSLG